MNEGLRLSTRGAALVALLAGLTLPISSASALAPDELVLVCNSDLPVSCELADYYARVRHVPHAQICELPLGARAGDDLPLADYERLVRDPIRAFLHAHGFERRIACLVTFYGVPIRVGESQVTPAQSRQIETLREQFLTTLNELEIETAKMASIGAAPVRPSARRPAEQDYPSSIRHYSIVRKNTQERLSKAVPTTQGASNFNAFFNLVQEIEGLASISEQVKINGGDANDERHKALAMLREEVRQAVPRIREGLSRPVDDPNRPQIRKQVKIYYGIAGLLDLLESDMQELRPQETLAALDSELMLLWVDHYPRHRWMPNLLSWSNRLEPSLRRPSLSALWDARPLMVSRLDASSPAVVRRMIDDAVAAEHKGLSGKIYLDAQGIYAPPKGQYDSSLRDLELLIKRNTSLSVTLDNKPACFGPGACPATMLYCGWYSLRRYIDSFTFQPGAVAWHIASFEAINLKDPGEAGWCKNLLDHGAAATLGPVAEPYLHSFPLPKEFFGLLLTGQFTLVECYAFTQNLSSWMTMLLGDPLYRPFAVHPCLKLEKVYPPERIPPELRPAVQTAAGSSTSGFARPAAPATSAPVSR